MLDVEDVEPVVRDDEEEEEESEGGPFPAVFKEFRANGKLDGEREIKQDNGYSGASMSHIGSSREGPITDKVAMHILDKVSTSIVLPLFFSSLSLSFSFSFLTFNFFLISIFFLKFIYFDLLLVSAGRGKGFVLYQQSANINSIVGVSC